MYYDIVCLFDFYQSGELSSNKVCFEISAFKIFFRFMTLLNPYVGFFSSVLTFPTPLGMFMTAILQLYTCVSCMLITGDIVSAINPSRDQGANFFLWQIIQTAKNHKKAIFLTLPLYSHWHSILIKVYSTLFSKWAVELYFPNISTKDLIYIFFSRLLKDL